MFESVKLTLPKHSAINYYPSTCSNRPEDDISDTSRSVRSSNLSRYLLCDSACAWQLELELILLLLPIASVLPIFPNAS